MMRNIGELQNDKCTGCMACKAVCKNNAINEITNKEGFVYPIVDNELCTNCGACVNSCCAISELNNEFDYEYAYALQADDYTRKNSSSGAAFYLLAKKILEQGGVVCGAVLEKDTVKHIVVEDINKIDVLRKSKYVQSSIYSIFEKVKDYIKNGTKVLFSGTACQCEAIQKFCGKKNSEILYTVDILCMGVPSPGLFKRYLDEELKPPIEKIDFRDKSVEGWIQNFYFSYEKNGNKSIINSRNSSFYSSFLSGYSLRENCYRCKYPGKRRISDITIGDFWHIGSYDKKLDDKKGTSLVIVSSEKGSELVNCIKTDCIVFEKVPIDYAIKTNSILLQPSCDKGLRKEFFERIESETIKNTVDYINNNKADCGIINYWWANDNGAILTAYALQQTLKELGFSSRLIDFSKENKKNGISQNFAKDYLSVTKPIITDKDYYELNDSFDHFLVGSDQVFRAEWVPDHWFLDFVDTEKNKIAVSASYGKKNINVTKIRKNKIQYFLSRFNAISVREIYGVKLTKDLGSKAVNIIDPVFYLTKQQYIDKLGLEKQHENNLFVYIRDLDENKKQLCCNIADKLNLHIFFADDNTQVQDFLSGIYNSSFVITDSYHGLCYSVIFNKKYLCIMNERRGLDRFDSLIDTLGLNRCFFINERELQVKDNKALSDSENWDSVNDVIKIKSDEAKNWIEVALRKPKSANMIKCNLFKFKVKVAHVKHYFKYKKNYLRIKKDRTGVVLFGAGVYGRIAIDKYQEQIRFFIDNSNTKKWFENYPVYTLEKAISKMTLDDEIIISTSAVYQAEIRKQLQEKGFKNIKNLDV